MRPVSHSRIQRAELGRRDGRDVRPLAAAQLRLLRLDGVEPDPVLGGVEPGGRADMVYPEMPRVDGNCPVASVMDENA